MTGGGRVGFREALIKKGRAVWAEMIVPYGARGLSMPLPDWMNEDALTKARLADAEDAAQLAAVHDGAYQTECSTRAEMWGMT